MKFLFKKLLQNKSWKSNVIIETDENGVISVITEDVVGESFEDIAIPGFQNAHSHSFQYAMAGLAENHPTQNGQSDFWSWREAMYKLALSVNPEQFEAIATMLYSEMLRHGYTNVSEFHYLHHGKDGKPYENLAEMGMRLVSAAKKTGINITLIPIFYQKGGFKREAEENQKRFISKTIDEYARLFETTKEACEDYENANIALGIHSMRAVEPSIIKEVTDNFPKDIPFHIHISEQLKEVEDSINYLGKRPVEWMLENIELSERFHFVHATHLTKDEIQSLANTKTNVVLCPTTEGSLGDGIFPLREFQSLGGNWSIGTDSHVNLNPFEELRLLDYGQRLISHKRKTFFDENIGNSGVYAIKQSQIAGRKAMNSFNEVYFEVGQPFNACVISSKHPLIQMSSDINLLNTIIYSSDETMQKGVIVNGKRRLKDDDYENEVDANFRKAIKELGNR